MRASLTNTCVALRFPGHCSDPWESSQSTGVQPREEVVHYFEPPCDRCVCREPPTPEPKTAAELCEELCPRNAVCVPIESNPESCSGRCAEGFRPSADQRSCVQELSCASGQFLTGQRCSRCPAGSFAEGSSSTRAACTPCPPGTNGPAGATSPTDCNEIRSDTPRHTQAAPGGEPRAATQRNMCCSRGRLPGPLFAKLLRSPFLLFASTAARRGHRSRMVGFVSARPASSAQARKTVCKPSPPR